MYSSKDHDLKFYWDGYFWRDEEGAEAPEDVSRELLEAHPGAVAELEEGPWDRQFSSDGRFYGYSAGNDIFTDQKQYTEPNREVEVKLRKLLDGSDMGGGLKTPGWGPDPRL